MSKHEPGRQLVTQQSYFFCLHIWEPRVCRHMLGKGGVCFLSAPPKNRYKSAPLEKKLKQKKNFELYQVFFFMGPQLTPALQCTHASPLACIQSAAANPIQKSTFSLLQQSQQIDTCPLATKHRLTCSSID